MEQEKVAEQSSPCSAYFPFGWCLVVVIGKLPVSKAERIPRPSTGCVVYFPIRKPRRLVEREAQSETKKLRIGEMRELKN